MVFVGKGGMTDERIVSIFWDVAPFLHHTLTIVLSALFLFNKNTHTQASELLKSGPKNPDAPAI